MLSTSGCFRLDLFQCGGVKQLAGLLRCLVENVGKWWCWFAPQPSDRRLWWGEGGLLSLVLWRKETRWNSKATALSLGMPSFYRSQNSQPSCRRTSAFGYWWAPRVHRLACTPMTASVEPNVDWTKCWHRSVFVGAMGRKWSKYLFAEALFRHGRKTERPEAGAARKQSKQRDVLAFSLALLCFNVTFWMTSHWHHMAQMSIVDSWLSDRSTYPAWHEQSCARRVASIALSRWLAKSDEESFDSWSWYCYRMLQGSLEMGYTNDGYEK